MAWGKSEQDRIASTLDYVKRVSTQNHQLLLDYVNGNSIHSAESISKALSLGFSRFKRHGTSKSQRHAIRGCILTKLAVVSPRNLVESNSWKSVYEKLPEANLQMKIRSNLAKLKPPVPLRPTKVKVNPVAIGLTPQQLRTAKSGLSTGQQAVVSPSVTSAGPPPLSTASMAQKKTFFEKLSRSHLVLSGHGSWPEPWPMVTLKPQQKLRCYIDHYYTLGNDVGQKIDNRQFPPPVDEYQGGTSVCDYTLHHKDSLTLLNHSVGDAQFITVDNDTLISTFINDARYSTAIFHFAACRVVTNNAGEIWCPTHNTWEPYNNSCI